MVEACEESLICKYLRSYMKVSRSGMREQGLHYRKITPASGWERSELGGSRVECRELL